MKKSFFSRFIRVKAREISIQKNLATSDDIKKKLEHYERKDGPAQFGSAGVYFVSEDEENPGNKE